VGYLVPGNANPNTRYMEIQVMRWYSNVRHQTDNSLAAGIWRGWPG